MTATRAMVETVMVTATATATVTATAMATVTATVMATAIMLPPDDVDDNDGGI